MVKTVTQLPPNFDLRALQIFVVAAEQGGMTQCARVLNLTQSGVSQTISSLEETIGDDLFDRSTRPIVLTSAGRSLLNHAHRILAYVQNAYVEASQSDRHGFQMVTIAMPESLANVLGPKLYRRKQDISSSWRIWSGLTPDHSAEFLSHAIDMMVTEEGHMSEVTGLQRYTIFSEPYVLIFPKDYDGLREIGPHLRSHKLVRFSLRSAAGRQIEAQLNRLSLKFPEQIEVDTGICQAAAVADGLGWGITTPFCLLQRPSLLDEMIVVPITRGSFSRHFSLVARENALGDAPQTIAEEIKAIINEEILPTLLERLPDLEGKLQIVGKMENL